MDFNLTEEQKILRDEVVRFSQKELNDDIVERDRAQKFDRALWEKCGEMGLQGLPVPEEYGGIGADPLTTAIVLEAFGYGCRDGGLVFAVCAHILACVVPIVKHGTEEQKQRFLPGLSDGSLIAVNGITEPGSGSDAFAMQTRAVAKDGGFVLNGTKTFSSNGPVADLAVIYAVTDPGRGYHGGITAFLVECDTPGYTPGQKFEKMGLRTCPIGELVLEDVFVPAENVIRAVGAGGPIFAQSMEWERACLVATHVGAMQRLLENAIQYARERKASGQSIGRFQAVAHRLANMKVRLEASRLLTYQAASKLDSDRKVGLDASIAKLFVSEAYLETAMDAIRTLGGYGYMAEYEAERAMRDAVGGTLYSGTNDIQRNIIARWLGLQTST